MDRIINIIINWLISALAIIIAAYILPGVTVISFMVALVLAIVLGAINAFIKPVLVILTLPLTIMTFGIFIFILNALLIMLAGFVVPGFSVGNFWWALLFSLVLALINSLFYRMGSKPKEIKG